MYTMCAPVLNAMCRHLGHLCIHSSASQDIWACFVCVCYQVFCALPSSQVAVRGDNTTYLSLQSLQAEPTGS